MYNCREGKTRAHTHTHTHCDTNHCGDDWFEGFIGDSQSLEAGRGSYALSRKTTPTSTQPGLLSPYVGGHGVRGTQFYLFY